MAHGFIYNIYNSFALHVIIFKSDDYYLRYATVPRGPKCLAMYWRCRTCGPTGKLTRDVLTNLRESITDASPNIRRCIEEYSGINRRYIG